MLCDGDNEQFGLTMKELDQIQQGGQEHHQAYTDSETKVKMMELDYNYVIENVDQIDISDNMDLLYPIEDLLKLFQQSVTAIFMARELQSKTATINVRDIFFSSFMASVVGILSKNEPDIEN